METARMLPNFADTARVTEHAFKTFRTLLMASRAAAEAICDTARRQQEVAFDMVRAAFAACPTRMADDEPQGSDPSWKRITTAYAQANAQGLEAVRAVTDTAFKVLHCQPGPAFGIKAAGEFNP